MAKPLYYRSSNPGLSNVTAKSNKLFEWDGTGSVPAEIANGKAFMPPAPVSGEYAIWADSYTLGYTNEADAAPIFFSDGGAGEAKILKMINSVANRLGVSKFSDVAAAKAWASSSPLINIGEPEISISNAYYLNLDDAGGPVTFHNGMLLGFPGASGGPYPWPTTTMSQFRIAKYDAFGNDRQADFENATRIRIEADASNYIEYDVTYAYTSSPLFSNGSHPMMLFNVSGVASSAGQRPQDFDYNVDPGYVTVSNVTPATPSYSIGDTGSVLLTYIIENNTSRNIMAIMPGGHIGTITQTPSPYVSGPYDTEVAWLPVTPGSSITVTDIAPYDTTGGANPGYAHFVATLQANFAFAPAPTALTAYVNGDLAFTGTPYTTNGHTSSIYRPGNNYVQNGDIIRFVYS